MFLGGSKNDHVPVLFQRQDPFCQAQRPQALGAVVIHVLFRPPQQGVIIRVVFNIWIGQVGWRKKTTNRGIVKFPKFLHVFAISRALEWTNWT